MSIMIQVQACEIKQTINISNTNRLADGKQY